MLMKQVGVGVPWIEATTAWKGGWTGKAARSLFNFEKITLYVSKMEGESHFACRLPSRGFVVWNFTCVRKKAYQSFHTVSYKLCQSFTS